MTLLNRLVPDRFVGLMLLTIIVAAMLPARGMALVVLSGLSTITIAMLFFLHGARISRAALAGAARRLRLQLVVLSFTFLAFPLTGVALRPLIEPWIGEALVPGFLFLCALPTTIASSVAMVSLARGNVAASVINAAISTMLGVIVTPLIIALLLASSGVEIGMAAIGRIALILVLPFAIGQFLRPKIGSHVDAHPVVTKMLDRLTILLAVYSALSAAAASNLLSAVGWSEIIALVVLALALLALALATAIGLGRALGYGHGDRMVLLFNGIHKSAISGTPMARILFPGAQAGLIILPLLAYYIPMLTISAILAARIGARESPDG
ncbi:MAG: bile acid:sodium symporter [Sphingomonadaceae bacterium]|nr:bile acid:sodium symporter [Sphingomonadaceae bacterium]